jgi:hypothetical protein
MTKQDFYDAATTGKSATPKPGDRVRFLNSVGGGVVTAFHGKNMVLVEDEFGFDMPVLISECVIIGNDEHDFVPKLHFPQTGSSNAANEVTSETANASTEAAPTPPHPTTPENNIAVDKPPFEPITAKPVIPATFCERPGGEKLNLSLAFLPTDTKDFANSNFEAYIINESNYWLFFNYISYTNYSYRTCFSRGHDLLEPDTKLFIEEITKENIAELEHLCLQIIAYKENCNYRSKKCYAIDFSLDPLKFYKVHCFTPNKFFVEDALVIPLIVNDTPEYSSFHNTVLLHSAPPVVPKKPKVEDSETKPAKVKFIRPAPSPFIEVDLHIHELLDTTTGMSNADILNYQLDIFRETMQANLKKTGRKIIFIHGNGEGVLRSAIEKELNTAYKHQCTYQDASFKEYGYGATMVIIH